MNKIKKSIIYLIIILTILLIAIFIAINNIENKEHGDYEVMGKNFSEEVHSMKISNFSVLESFVGSENNKGIIMAKMYRKFFCTEIPKIKEELQSNQDLSEYYKIEKEKIKNYYFEMDEESFSNLCTKIKSMKADLKSEYDDCSFSLNESEDLLVVTCHYQNGEEITLEMSSDEKVTVK